ncbi:CDGSH iron-sulfur domain-containing protein 3, mitochondrial-like [Haliotis cracherodii]|uniref:CDGSH iron-sulfur domain-containing protein 3, mitochondrial-like n=1 Tax=Haliotis cracherodii TaxID=6455 RepID=UPI0039EA62DD
MQDCNMALYMNRCASVTSLFKNCSFFGALSQTRALNVDDFVTEKKKKNKFRQHRETPKFVNEFSTDQPKGKIYDKKPFRIELTAGKKYAWCACGHSHTQPLCDGTHKTLWGTSESKNMPKWGPVRFSVEETKEYWLCNCKQTNNRPFCDGTHKLPHVQAVK